MSRSRRPPPTAKIVKGFKQGSEALATSAANSLSICYTPYHLLLALSWEDAQGPCSHVVVGDARFPPGLAGELARRGRNVTFLPGRVGLSRPQRVARSLRLRRGLARLVRQARPVGHLLIGSDLTPEADAVARAGNGRLELLEDGIGLYLGEKAQVRRPRKRLAELGWALLWGRGRAQHDSPGRHPRTSDVWALHPGLVTVRPAHALAVSRRAVEDLTAAYSASGPDWSGPAGRGRVVLCFTPGPEHPRYDDLVRAMRAEVKPGEVAVIKRHPRDVRQQPEDWGELAPAELPAEVVIGKMSDRLTKIVTSQSTVCYSGRALGQNVRETVVVDLAKEIDAGLIAALNPGARVVGV